MKFFANDIRAMVAMDENGNFSQERADAFQEFMNEEMRNARADGWAKATRAIAYSFAKSDREISSKIAERGHNGNHFAND